MKRSLSPLVAVGFVVALTVSGCATDEKPGAPSSSAYAPPSAISPSVKRPAPGPSVAAATAKLGAASLQLNKALEPLGLNQKVAVAIVPVGVKAAPIAIGDTSPAQVAWSTIKVPLAVAAERKHGGPMPQTVAAIINSDNNAAQALWDSLGAGAQAAAAVTRVLREGGDATTTVPAVVKRAPYTIFGQTSWSVVGAAQFTAGLACMPGGDRVRKLMGRVDGNQQWGADVLKTHTEVKGGWGPGVVGGYVVRQIALITFRDGSQTAVAMVTFGAGTSMTSGTSALNHVGTWLGRNINSLPRGYC
ncbi:MAG TPA: hypothetical protein PK331_00620 [Gordonia sp. (in: high G+C Gram-positive bacteria)]|uniref:hypothetical protein n=1 Tax=unclassified Gordonia (in: high G+C Gram-positive bacteria) TaxID=2657482 RepID=UPI000F949C18|nr:MULTISPECIES: hypothetical protein [unclassified Gordonia (in: high G+C Gram-positive bacteria)]RUP36001.1 MAG: hypothetical protein EKK60_16285 [Gordonia sp. (in: high G+C Gram-positive bacteria)]HNP55677.1 hypothetical protein [Gordonia sp. (in: high G+C Gram-positive bacteria)]HRC49413.1 hypothetical protein [Gordonia sp. (in: high G+C Gram-positive bacteria)]